MLDNTLSVCLIAKNEEKNIIRCLRSIFHIADEIILVDTGSTDKTISLARDFGAKVISHPWKNDFSDARNMSLEHATKNWILFLDADEEIPYEDGINLKNILAQNSQFEAFHLRLVNIIGNVNTGDAIVLRVFKNNPKYRFKGKMHEQVINSIEALNPPGVIGATDIKILHYGYDPNVSDIYKKQQRNIELLNSYAEEDKDGYYYYSLGNEYARVDDFDKALEIYEKTLNIELPEGNCPIYVPYLYLNICKVLFNYRKFTQLDEKIKGFLKTHSNFRDLYFYSFLGYSQCCHFKKAKMALEKYLSCPSGNYEYPCSNFDAQYNIHEIIQNLNQTVVDHKDNLISAIIMVDKDYKSLTETIKGLNEIADEIVILLSENTDIDEISIENIGGKILKVSSTEKGEIFMNGLKSCNGDFVLLLKPDEFLPFEKHKSLVDLLESTSNEYFDISIFDTKTNSTSNEFRLFKNSDNIKEFTDFNELINYISSNKAQYFPLQLQKIYFD